MIHIHPYYQRLLRATAIKIFWGIYPTSKKPNAKNIHRKVKGAYEEINNNSEYMHVRESPVFREYIELISISDIGKAPQSKFDILLGEGADIKSNLSEKGKNELIRCLNALCCLDEAAFEIRQDKFPLYKNWQEFEKRNPIPEHIDNMITGDLKPFGFLRESTFVSKQNAANEIESAVQKAITLNFKNLADDPDLLDKNHVDNLNIPSSNLQDSNTENLDVGTKQIHKQNETSSNRSDVAERFVCFRSSTNGRFIHVYPVTIYQNQDVLIKKLKTYKNKYNGYKDSPVFEESGKCISLSSNRRLIQIFKEPQTKVKGADKEIASLSIFENDEEKKEYRGFRLGYDWKTKAAKLSVTRFYLISVEELENRLTETSKNSESLKDIFLNKLPFDIKVNSRAYSSIPFHPEMRFLPMRLGGVFDNAMTFYDGGNNEDLALPDFAMLRVFFNAAKGALAKPKNKLVKEDYKLAAEYLTKSIEHGLTGHIRNISEYNEIHGKDQHKETNTYSYEILRTLFNGIVGGVDKLAKPKIESWNDEFLKLRRRFDETKNYSESSDINTPKLKQELNYLYRVAKEGVKEDKMLTVILNKIFKYVGSP